MLRRFVIILLILTAANNMYAQKLPEYEPLAKKLSPVELAQFVANKIVDETVFRYNYNIQIPYTDLLSVDFGKSLDRSSPGVAYALSSLYSEAEQIEVIEVGSTNKLKIWVNDKLVYFQEDDAELPILFQEKTYKLPKKFEVSLNKGENKILVKSAYDGRGDWLILMQSKNLGPYSEIGKKIKASLQNYAPDINMVNWLILGCFENPEGQGINTEYSPEKKIEFHKIYRSDGNLFTWDIPRIHLNTGNPDGGKFYSWSYHVGGFMWALQRLSQETGNRKYFDFANNWCEYTLNTIPLAEYQTKKLHAVRSMNWGSAGRPMLDYTSAPSIPFITRLVYEESFPQRKEYIDHAEKIMNYLIHEQFRLPDGIFARNYTTTPSVWADDMFMGVPYLLFAAQYCKDPILQKELFSDVANQIIQFNRYLFREDKRLYMQACYADRPHEVIPYWSRGNGWALWGTTEVLQYLPKDHKQYDMILNIYREHVRGIAATQDSLGYWHNILDMPETVRESSGTAIFTLCIARGINNGWLDRNQFGPVVDKGWRALYSFVGEDGNLYGVKGGTNFSPNPEDYAKTPFVKSDTHGLLPLLFACIEMELYLKQEHSKK